MSLRAVFWRSNLPFIRLNGPPGNCFVAKNAPRNDIHNGFETGLNSYRFPFVDGSLTGWKACPTVVCRPLPAFVYSFPIRGQSSPTGWKAHLTAVRLCSGRAGKPVLRLSASAPDGLESPSYGCPPLLQTGWKARLTAVRLCSRRAGKPVLRLSAFAPDRLGSPSYGCPPSAASQLTVLQARHKMKSRRTRNCNHAPDAENNCRQPGILYLPMPACSEIRRRAERVSPNRAGVYPSFLTTDFLNPFFLPIAQCTGATP